MNKRHLLAAIALLAMAGVSCRLFKPRVAPYPAGVSFPVVEDKVMAFAGKPSGGTIRARGGLVFLGTQDGTVRAIDAAKKLEVWKFKTDKRLLAPLSLGAENIYVHDGSDILYCLNPKGELLWKRPVDERILTTVVEGGGRVLFGTDKGKLWSVSLDGREAREFQAGGAISNGPLVVGDRIVFGSDDGTLHAVDAGEKSVWELKAPGKIVGPLASDGKLLFFNTEDRRLFGLRIGRTRPKWKVRIGGLVINEPVVRGGRLYLLASNSVLYCIGKTDGDILWWANIPSRTAYDLAVVEDKVIVTSLSTKLLAFDARTGKAAGEYMAARELKTNAIWIDPLLVVGLHDDRADEGGLAFLRKDVQVRLTPQKASPQPAGEEIGFSVTVVGFQDPQYEFYVKSGDKREIAQKASDKNSWTWYAGTEGSYVVGVKVTDAKQEREGEVPFVIDKKPETKPQEPAIKEIPK